MPVPPALLAADRDRQFDDWAEPVTLRRTTQSFDPETLTVQETTTDTPLDALVGVQHATPTPGAAGQHFSNEHTFTFKRENFPQDALNPTTRILWNTRAWRPTDIREAPTAHLITLLCIPL